MISPFHGIIGFPHGHEELRLRALGEPERLPCPRAECIEDLRRDHHLERLVLRFRLPRIGLEEITAEKVATDIYKVRNSLVHFRAALGTVQRTNEEWDNMISAMLDLVKDVYQRHGARFNLEPAAE